MNKLYIVGLPNTGTSTLVGMLNSHRDILICYETWQSSAELNKYAYDLILMMPSLRDVYSGKYNMLEAFDCMHNILKNSGFNYKVVGDKIVNFSINDLSYLSSQKVIYITRPLDEWLVKREVRRGYVTDFDSKTPAVHFLNCLNHANIAENWIRITLKDLLLRPTSLFNSVSNILKVDVSGFNDKWWKSYDYMDPLKNSMKWFEAHPSSLLPPQHNPDVSFIRKKHDFWKLSDEIVNALFNHMPAGYDGEKFNYYKKTISDLDKRYGILPLSDLYENYSETAHGRKKEIMKDSFYLTLIKKWVFPRGSASV